MSSSPDILCACAMFFLGFAASATYGVGRSLLSKHDGTGERMRAAALPRSARTIALRGLSPIVHALTALGVSANAVTALSLVGATGASVLLSYGHFGIGALLFAAASLGDAVDGLVARATHTDCASGALFDASVDRYEEFFAFGGLAIFFRSSKLILALTLLALVGSFMVSYGSAKAEALKVAVPPGPMRRAERAASLSVGLALAPIVGALADRLGGPSWAGETPIVLAIAFIGVSANVSAVRRLREVAVATEAKRDPGDAGAGDPSPRTPAMEAGAE